MKNKILLFLTFSTPIGIILLLIIAGVSLSLGYFVLMTDYEYTPPVESNQEGVPSDYINTRRFHGIFTETPGQLQGDWGSDTITKMLNNPEARKFQQYWGTSYDLQTDSMKEWRENSRWGVPFYYQSSTKDDMPLSYGVIHFNSVGSNSLNGCAFYMSAYIASALTGDLINTAEMASALIATNGVTDSGLYRNGASSVTFNKLGIDFVQFSISSNKVSALNTMGIEPISSSYWSDRWYYIDQVLYDGGIVGLSAHKRGPFTSYGHYMVITGKDVATGKYTIYTSSRPGQTKQLWDRSDFDGKLRPAGYFFAKKR